MMPSGAEIATPTTAMRTLPDRVGPATLRRLQLRLRTVLRAPGRHHDARPAQGSGDAGSDSPVQGKPEQSLDSWLDERRHLGTRLSDDELWHGIDAGIIRGLGGCRVVPVPEVSRGAE